MRVELVRVGFNEKGTLEPKLEGKGKTFRLLGEEHFWQSSKIKGHEMWMFLRVWDQ